MNQKVAQALNEQVIFEFNAASTYLALSLAMADANFKGFSAWLRAQYQEEVTHAFKFIDYLQSNNEKVTLGDVKNTASTLTNPLDVAKAVLAQNSRLICISIRRKRLCNSILLELVRRRASRRRSKCN